MRIKLLHLNDAITKVKSINYNFYQPLAKSNPFLLAIKISFLLFFTFLFIKQKNNLIQLKMVKVLTRVDGGDSFPKFVGPFNFNKKFIFSFCDQIQFCN